MSGINRQPRGLLDFLQSQAGGQNPGELLESVRPTIDIEKFYFPDRMRAVRDTFNGQGLANLQFHEVPADEVWLLKSIAIGCVLLPAETAKFSFWIERLPGQGLNGIAIRSLPEMSNPSTVNQTIYEGHEFATPWVLTPGQRLVTRLDSVTPAANQVDLVLDAIYVLYQLPNS